jgi:peptidoglycan/LPS O-acetylase OafA/YrhL
MRFASERDGQEEGGSAAANRHALVDVIRGVSILLVILLHVQIRIPFQKMEFFQAAPTALGRFLFRNGNDGVRMFFVISGFLITSTSLRRWGKPPAPRCAAFLPAALRPHRAASGLRFEIKVIARIPQSA